MKPDFRFGSWVICELEDTNKYHPARQLVRIEDISSIEFGKAGWVE